MKRVLVIIILGFTVTTLAFADRLTNGDYIMYVNPSSSGGGTLQAEI